MLKMLLTFHDISTNVVDFNFTMLAQHQHGEIGKISPTLLLLPLTCCGPESSGRWVTEHCRRHLLETAEGQSRQSVLQDRSSKSETKRPKKESRCPGEEHLLRLVPLQHLQEPLHLLLPLLLLLHIPQPLRQPQVDSSHKYFFSF